MAEVAGARRPARGEAKGLSGNVLCFTRHLLRVLARAVSQPVAFARCLLLGTAAVSVLGFDHDSLDEPAIKVWNS